MEKLWLPESRKILVSVDSYYNGVLRGKYFCTDRGEERFESLSQFLIRLEDMLEENQLPQSYTGSRTFSPLRQSNEDPIPVEINDGAQATFELKILFRQHTSWQGIITWLDRKAEQSFRSVLELVLLLDSALQGGNGAVDNTNIA